MTYEEAIESLKNKRTKLCKGSFYSDHGDQMDCWGECGVDGCEFNIAVGAITGCPGSSRRDKREV